MENRVAGRLVGTEIHGFKTMADLDIANVLEEAKTRWLRPNEIHAILCNHKHFSVQVKPVTLPPSGTMVLFDRKMLRNFRKDGHNWKKKKDGKTVKEAHEHLKVGNEERIHVYYAHGEDNSTFVRRCYWLLDKSLEHIVLVHYRETQELQAAPATPGNSNSSSGNSDPSASWVLSEESDSVLDRVYYSSQKVDLDPSKSSNVKDYELRLHEINTLDWDELLVSDDSNRQGTAQEGGYSVGEPYNYDINGFKINSHSLLGNKLPVESYKDPVVNFNMPTNVTPQAGGGQITSHPQRDLGMMTMGTGHSLENLFRDGLQTQDSFGRWINDIIADSPVSANDTTLESSISTIHQSYTSPSMGSNFSSVAEQIFYINDISPSSASSTEETKILVVGFFREGLEDLANSSVFCNCGDICFPAAVVQPGVFRFIVSPQAPGVVNLFFSFDGHKPISQVVAFEFRAPPIENNWISCYRENSKWDEFPVQLRLAHLLFSTSRTFDVLSSKVSPSTLKEAKKFAQKASNITDGWTSLAKSISTMEISFLEAKDSLFELTLKNRLYEWLLERVIEGRKITEHDEQGQGVIHLCAILGYTWAAYPFSWSGLSLDYRDKHGWTALHWAANYGREEMVAKLLSAGAKANLVTDPTPENPGGYTAADLASKNGHEGLGAYLAEKGLVQQFEDMTLAGNVSGSLQTAATTDSIDSGNFTEEETHLKDTLAAYRTAADAAARIQTAFREHSLKLRTQAVESSNPEIEARNIVAAMKIQHAFRNYGTRKKMAAAARIQYRFRTWKIRREFLNMRRQAIKIQAIFRGFQVRRQYRKIIWSVGVLEKAVLRWRLKRKGFRGLQVQPETEVNEEVQESVAEEDFFQASRKLAEERVERSVVRVQAMFRSKRAQEEYARMKLAYNTATREYEELRNPYGMNEEE